MEDLKTKSEKYINIETEAMKSISIAVPENSALHIIATDFLQMAKDYFVHFELEKLAVVNEKSMISGSR